MITRACVSVGILLLFSSCNRPPETFRAGTEFGARLTDELNTSHGSQQRIRAYVEYPLAFQGSMLQGSLSVADQGNHVLIFDHLSSNEKNVCVTGTLAAVANSQHAFGHDDAGGSLAVLHVRSPDTQLMTTQQVCTGQQDQQSCVPMTYPLVIPGQESIVLHTDKPILRLKRGSLIVANLSDAGCSSQ
jgi:hypothetical protein